MNSALFLLLFRGGESGETPPTDTARICGRMTFTYPISGYMSTERAIQGTMQTDNTISGYMETDSCQ